MIKTKQVECITDGGVMRDSDEENGNLLQKVVGFAGLGKTQINFESFICH